MDNDKIDLHRMAVIILLLILLYSCYNMNQNIKSLQQDMVYLRQQVRQH